MTPKNFIIVLGPLASMVPLEIRLRRLLKLASRYLKLRCVSMSAAKRTRQGERAAKCAASV